MSPLLSRFVPSQVAAGSVTLAAPALGGAGSTYAASQDLASATVSTSVVAPGGAAAGGRLNTTAFIAASENTVVATLVADGPVPVALTVTLAQVQPLSGAQSLMAAPVSPHPPSACHRPQTNGYGLPTGAGIMQGVSGSATMAWTAKGGVTDTANSAILMPCDAASFIVHPSVRTFAPDAGLGVVRVANFSAGNDSAAWPCLALRDAGETNIVTISSDCASPLARFALAQVSRSPVVSETASIVEVVRT